jgi:hypothetical protein
MRKKRRPRTPSSAGSSPRRSLQDDVEEARKLGRRILAGIVGAAPQPQVAGLALAVVLGALAATIEAAGREEFYERVVGAAQESAREWEVTLIAARVIH